MAIAYDNSSEGAVGASTTLTYSHTCTGSNTFLKVDFRINGASGSVSSVTYAGVSMTQLANVSANGVYTYYLINPATGANNVVITTSGSGEITSYSASYTGVKQTSPIDSQNTVGSGSVSDTTVVVATTVVASNCWLLGFGAFTNSFGSATISSNRTDRQAGNHGGYATGVNATSDSNGTVATGSQSTTWTIAGDSGNKTQAAIVFSILPYVPQTVTLVMAQGAFTLTGYTLAFILTRVLTIALETGTFTFSLFTATFRRVQTFVNQAKSATSWTNQDKS